MPNTPIQQLPFFRPMEPAVQDLYDRLMRLADDCQNDRVVPVDDLQWMVRFAGALHFTNIMSGIVHAAEQSRMLEEESREMAYILLKIHGAVAV